jgi:hypothetical protein
MNKVDDSLLEVWEMKKTVYEDFKNSKFENIVDYIENEMIDIRKFHNIKYHLMDKEKETQLKTA